MPNLVSWTREEEKAFENAIATHSIDKSNEEWDKVASMVPTKTIEEIKQHYEFLVEDVGAIEAGKVPLPNYGSEDTTTTTTLSTSNTKDNQHPSFNKDQRGNSNQGNGYSAFGPSSMGNNTTKANSKLEQERKKGIPWTEEEHRLFLLGLDKFGKGDWRSISRNFVITRTPTQVASHAQKYFIRLNSMNRDRRRSSIHDITSVNGGGLSPNQTPITGQQNNTSVAPAVGTAAVAANKHRPPPNVNMAPAGIGMYGTQIGHPVTAAPPPPHHMASAVGTPVMLPPPGHPHHHHHHHPPPHYAVPVAYPLAPPPMHR
ncbi:transcription factor SRM1-like [Chenopodium quinoa]|uniref:transcription factor SRM1-like n=1 Tax=Chenopodium quinoa TaxID=63459 RepID=UPI000B78374E|nr:transcription factor SRM1-like [Chenopodium quinoa]